MNWLSFGCESVALTSPDARVSRFWSCTLRTWLTKVLFLDQLRAVKFRLRIGEVSIWFLILGFELLATPLTRSLLTGLLRNVPGMISAANLLLLLLMLATWLPRARLLRIFSASANGIVASGARHRARNGQTQTTWCRCWFDEKKRIPYTELKSTLRKDRRGEDRNLKEYFQNGLKTSR